MNYTFEIQKLDTDQTIFYLVKIDDESYYILNRFSDSRWNSQKIEDIIIKLEKHKSLPDNSSNDPFVWGNEDISILVNKSGVTLIDTLSVRHGETNQDKFMLELTHELFLQFLNDFKSFVKQNN